MKISILSLSFLFVSVLILSACGRNFGSNNCIAGQTWNGTSCVYTNAYNQTGLTTNNNGSCPANQINTQFGCLNQGGPCPAGQGWEPRTNACYPANNGFVANPFNNGINNPFNFNQGINPQFNNGLCQAPYFVQMGTGCMARCAFNYNFGNCVNF